MQWHDISDPNHSLLDELAATYSIHHLHLEDCRQEDQRTKVETNRDYLFVSLKLVLIEHGNRLSVSDLAVFAGSEFLITVHSGAAPMLEPLRGVKGELRPDEALYRVLDAVVDSYLPLTEKLEDTIETLEDQVVDWPRPSVLEHIGEIRGAILQFRRVVNATRHIASQLRHIPEPLIARDLSPFLRDVHDDLAIILDLIAGDRDQIGRAHV